MLCVRYYELKDRILFEDWEDQKSRFVINLDKVDKNGHTIIDHIILNDLKWKSAVEFRVFRFLVDYAESHGRPVLHTAVKWGKMNMFLYLFNVIEDMDALNSDGHTAIQVAVDSDNSYAADYLLGRGADPTLRYPDGNRIYRPDAVTPTREAPFEPFDASNYEQSRLKHLPNHNVRSAQHHFLFIHTYS